MELKFYAKHSDLLPQFATDGAAGFDMRAAEDIILQPFKAVKIPTGLRFEVPVGYELQIRMRSGLAAKGVILANGAGTVDSDYRGEVMGLLMWTGEGIFPIARGDRIIQGVLSKLDRPSLIAVRTPADLSQTKRGDGGFGSTGVK